MSTEETGKKYKFIVGTEGKLDYLVVARNGNTALGVKPLLENLGSEKGVFIGARIRASAFASEGDVIAADDFTNVVDMNAGSWDKSFPDFDWTKSNSKRASCVIGVAVPRSISDGEGLKEALSKMRYWWKVIDFIGKRVGSDDLMVGQDDVRQFLRTKYEHMIDKKAKTPLVHAEIDENAAVGYHSDVIAQLLKPVSETEQKKADAGFTSIDGDKADEPEDVASSENEADVSPETATAAMKDPTGQGKGNVAPLPGIDDEDETDK